MFFKRIINWFIPASFEGNVEKKLRATNIVSTALLIFPIGMYYALLYASSDFFIGMVALLSCSFLELTAPFIIRAKGNTPLAGLVVNLSIFLAIFGLATVTGGIYSPSAIWFAAIPVLAILMNGRLAGIIWSLVILITAVGMHLTDLLGHPFPDMLPYEVLSPRWKNMQVVANVLFILFILIASLAAEKSRMRTFKELISSKSALQQKMYELEEAHEEISASEEELRQNAEVMRETNVHLEQAQQELRSTLQVEMAMGKELKKSEERLSNLIETMKEGLVTVDREGYITFANKSLCEMFGYDLEEILHRHPTDFLDEANRQIFKKEYQRRLEGQNMPYEIEWLCKNGSKVSTIVSPQAVYEDEGIFSGSVAVLTDVTLLKKVQHELRKREERLRAIFASATVGIALINREGQLHMVNQAWLNMTGYSEPELAGKPYLALIHPDDHAISWATFQELLGGQLHAYRAERRFLRKNGEAFWVSVSPSCLLDAAGRVENVIVVVVDINDQKNAEEALKESEKKFRMVLDKANEAIVVSVDHRIVLHNPKLEEITGCSEEELKGAHISQFIHPEDWPLVAQRRQDVIPNPEELEGTVSFFRMVNKKGEVRWFGTVTSRTEWEGKPAFQDMLEDIHDRKIAEQQLRNYEVIISTASELMALIDRKYVFQAVNQAYANILQLTEHDIAGKTVAEVLGENNFQNFLKEKLDRCFDGETIRYQRWHEWGEKRYYLDVIYQPVIGPDGNISNLVVVSKDISEIKEAEEELNEKNKALNDSNKELKKTIKQLKAMQSQLINSEKMASLGQLTAGIAHEINNPVNFISGNIGPLSRDLGEIREAFEQYQQAMEATDREKALQQLNEYLQQIDAPFIFGEMEALVEGIKEGAARTKEIVLGLRNFSRLDEDDIKKSDINSGLDSTLTLLHNHLKHRIEVIRNYGQLPLVECYPGKLNQVFMNILNNAQQAIPEKGEIFISTAPGPDHVTISIRDTGEGMPHRVKARIFDPFFTTKEVGEGTGLGLSISYGIIQQHKGKIEVKSKKGEGTEFIITLPIRQ